MAKKPLARIIFTILLGIMIGSLLGQLLGLILPAGVVREFFLRSTPLEVGPATINLGLFSITLGFKLILNVVGFIGVLVAVYILRWY